MHGKVVFSPSCGSPLFLLVMSCTKEKALGVAFCNIDHAHHAFHSVVQMHLYFLMYKQCIEYLENCYNLFQIPDVATIRCETVAF